MYLTATKRRAHIGIPESNFNGYFLYLKERLMIRPEKFGGTAFSLDKNIHYCVNKDAYNVLRLIKDNSPSSFLKIAAKKYNFRSNEYGITLVNRVYNAIMAYVDSKETASLTNAGDGELLGDNNLVAPLRIILEIDFKRNCNLHCKFCYEDTLHDKTTDQLLSKAEIFKLIDSAKNLGVFHFQLMGGEPLVRNDIIDIMQHIVEQGIAVCITTNGVLLGKYLNEFKKLNKTGLFLPIQISLHGVSPETYHETTGNPANTFSIVLKNLAALKTKRIPFSIKYVVTNKNWKDLPLLFKIAEKYGAKTITLLHLLPIGGGKNEKEIVHFDTSAKKQIVKIIKDAKKSHKFYIDYRPLVATWYPKMPSNSLEEFVDCPAGNIDMRIRADGKVLQCSAVRQELFDLRATSLKHAWKAFNEVKVPCPTKCFVY